MGKENFNEREQNYTFRERVEPEHPGTKGMNGWPLSVMAGNNGLTFVFKGTDMPTLRGWGRVVLLWPEEVELIELANKHYFIVTEVDEDGEHVATWEAKAQDVLDWSRWERIVGADNGESWMATIPFSIFRKPTPWTTLTPEAFEAQQAAERERRKNNRASRDDDTPPPWADHNSALPERLRPIIGGAEE